MSLNTPILFIVFNRLDCTIEVFQKIRQQKPKYFFVAADGPRKNRIDDAAKCSEVRNYIKDNVDWECEFYTNFQEENLGMAKAEVIAMNWFFDNVEEGIILEDDCLPSDDFFWFATLMLEKYRNEGKVMEIAGTNVLYDNPVINKGFYFSKYGSTWGWATWRRAWKLYNFDLSTDLSKKRKVDLFLADKKDRYHWMYIFKDMIKLKDNAYTWDYQWKFIIWYYDAFCVVPQYNLISNLGFNENGTNTKGDHIYSKMPLQNFQNKDLEFPTPTYNVEADSLISNFYYDKSHHPFNRLIQKFKNLIHKVFKISI